MGIPGTKVRNPHCMKFGGDSVQWGFRPVGIPGTYRLGVSIEMEKLTSNEGFVHFELVFLVNVCSTVKRLHFC